MPFKKSLLILGALNLFMFLQATAQPSYPRDPQEAKIIYTDLVHFMDAYNELSNSTDSIQVLQTLYFDRGSDGLKEYISRHQLTPELLKAAMLANPERYALLPGFLANVSEIEESYAELMKDYNQVMPNAMYPPTYFLVGANRGIAQASLVGQLITITRVTDNRNKLHKLMAHELSHFQQAMAMGGQKYGALYVSPDNMLGLCLREGGAEFVTSLVLDDITQTEALEYIEQDESRLKEQFLTDLATQNKDFWLWASIEQKKYPKLLGYAMGYKICKSYYEQAPDKTVALQNILEMEDAAAFMESSQYFNR